MVHRFTASLPLQTGLSPADYFGHTIVQISQNIKVGVINVAVGGCKIELLRDKDQLSNLMLFRLPVGYKTW